MTDQLLRHEEARAEEIAATQANYNNTIPILMVADWLANSGRSPIEGFSTGEFSSLPVAFMNVARLAKYLSYMFSSSFSYSRAIPLKVKPLDQGSRLLERIVYWPKLLGVSAVNLVTTRTYATAVTGVTFLGYAAEATGLLPDVARNFLHQYNIVGSPAHGDAFTSAGIQLLALMSIWQDEIHNRLLRRR